MKLIIAISATVLCALPNLAAQGQGPASPDTPPQKIPVYVTNFELDVVPLSQAQKLALAAAGPSQGSQPSQPGTNAEPPDPAKQASHLVDLMAMKLVAALRNAGYTANRLRPGDGRPASGMQIRGVFTEVDDQNQWRRAVIRTGLDTGRMAAMVAIGNLARPDQALYELAHLPGNTNRPGAVITLSPYVPLEKFDVDKNASEDVFDKVASRIVADLTAFLKSNPAAVTQSSP